MADKNQTKPAESIKTDAPPPKPAPPTIQLVKGSEDTSKSIKATPKRGDEK